jgi:RNA polymerase sigma-70 factor (ECF subfamily)
MVYSFALYMTGKATDAADLCQEIWLQVTRSLRRFEGRCSLKTWIQRIAANVYRHSRRRKELHCASLDTVLDLPDPSQNPQASAESAETSLKLRRALTQLPEAQREIVVLHELLGFSYSQVAKALGCPVGTVKSRLHLAMNVLRKTLRE